MQIRRIAAVLGTCVALFTLGQPPSSADADPVVPSLPAPGFPHLNDLVVGTVTSGSTPIAGATVTLTAWPNAAALDALPDGAEVPTRTVATAQSDASGAYTLAPRLATLPSDYTEPSGAVSLVLEAAKDGVAQSHNVAAALANSAAGATSDSIAEPGRPAVINFDRAAQTASDSTSTAVDAGTPDGALASALTSAATHPGTADATADTGIPLGGEGNVAAGSASMPVPAFIPRCGPWHAQKERIYGAPEHFVNVYTWSGAPATVDEEVGSEHSLGAAMHTIGTVGWSATAGIEISTATSNGAAAVVRSSKAEYNQVNYRYFLQSCWAAANGHFTGNNKQWRPTGFFALTPQGIEKSVSHPYWNSHLCSDYKAGQRVVKSKGANTTYTAGVDLGFISVSSHASFSSNMTITFQLTQDSEVCGSTAEGLVKSPQIEVHKKLTNDCGPGVRSFIDDVTGESYVSAASASGTTTRC